MMTAWRYLVCAFVAWFVLGELSLAGESAGSTGRRGNEIAARLARQFPFLAKVPRVRENAGDYVVLVHGFTWAKPTLWALGRHLNKEGFHTIEVYYPTHSIAIDAVLDDFVRPALREHCTDPNRRVHFVGHSMGCVMIRQLLTQSRVDNLGNVVLLAAPNKGVEMADFFARSPVLKRFLGASVLQIGATADSVPNRLGPVTFSPGIIMGTRSDFPFISKVLPGADDGVVRVDSGRVAGMAALITLPTTHIRMPDATAVRAQTVHFLRTGKFMPQRPAADGTR